MGGINFSQNFNLYSTYRAVNSKMSFKINNTSLNL